MERHARYLMILALLVAVMLTAWFFWLWLDRKGENAQGSILQIFFAEPVNGLNPGSNVRFLGVNAGKVQDISLQYRDGQPLAMVRVSLDPVVRLDQGMRASLETSGITGQSTIALNPAPEAGVPQLENGIATLAGEPSPIGQLVASAPRLADRTELALEGLTLLLSPENIVLTQELLRNLRDAAANANLVGTQMSSLLEELRSSNQRFQETLVRFDRVAEEMDDVTLPAFAETAVALRGSAGVVRDSANSMREEIQTSAQIFREFIGETGQSMQQISDQFLKTALRAEQFAEELREQPSRLLYRNPETTLELAE